MPPDPHDPIALFDRKSLTDGIVFRLSVIETCLKWHSKRGENDNCKTVEFVVARFLGTLCGWDLERLEQRRKNHPAADLGDFERKICVQVTVNESTQKIIDTHEKAAAHDLAGDFDRLILLFLLPEAPGMPGTKAKFTPCLMPAVEVWARPELDREIDKAPLERLREALRVLRDEMTAIDRLIASTRISNLPFDTLGPLFIGRDGFMDTLGAALQAGTATVIKAVQAIHGMGGVGKTRAAVEYAWRHAADFRALLFVTADSPDALRRNLAALCAPGILGLPEHAATDIDTQVRAVLQWLHRHPDWLLILDNVDTADAQASVRKITTPLTAGTVLITSRLAAWPTGFAALDLDVLTPDGSVRLLLDHTAGRRVPENTDPQDAAEIARLVDGLALALEQAAAYVRKVRCSLAAYLARWREAETRLIEEHRTGGIDDYPRSLRVTFGASFSQLAPPARHLLEILSWLAPDPMPAAHLESLAALPAAAETLADLDDLHLIRRSPDNRAFAVHRLIQEILRRQQTEEQPPALTEALEWVNGLYQGDPGDVRLWDLLAPLTPHAVAISAADHGSPELTARLLNQAAIQLNAQADHLTAEPLMRRALMISENHYGPEHPEVAATLNNLAQLLHSTNRLKDAERLLHRTLAILGKIYSDDHPDWSSALSNLASLMWTTGRYKQAEPLMYRALMIDEKHFGPMHRKVAIRLNNIAQLHKADNRLSEAEPLMRRTLAILETTLGKVHPDVAVGLCNLAELLRATNQPQEAETLMRRALSIDEAAYGEMHPNVGTDLNNLASLLQSKGQIEEAETMLRRSLKIWEDNHGAKHPNVAAVLCNLGQLLETTNRREEAEPLRRRSLAILLECTAATGCPHPQIRAALANYAFLLRVLGRSDEETSIELVSLGREHGVDLSAVGGWGIAGISPQLRPVLDEIMRDPSRLTEILARLKEDAPALLEQLVTFIQSQQG